MARTRVAMVGVDATWLITPLDQQGTAASGGDSRRECWLIVGPECIGVLGL